MRVKTNLVVLSAELLRYVGHHKTDLREIRELTFRTPVLLQRELIPSSATRSSKVVNILKEYKTQRKCCIGSLVPLNTNLSSVILSVFCHTSVP